MNNDMMRHLMDMAKSPLTEDPSNPMPQLRIIEFVVKTICSDGMCRHKLEETYGKAWERQEFLQEFDILFDEMDPMIFVQRKGDGKKGLVLRQFDPELFFCYFPMPGPERPNSEF
jgi:hypothetical protein